MKTSIILWEQAEAIGVSISQTEFNHKSFKFPCSKCQKSVPHITVVIEVENESGLDEHYIPVNHICGQTKDSSQ